VKREPKSNSDGNQSMTKYIGMDLHKNFLQIAVMDSYGTVLENTRIENDMEKIDGFFV
jgi:predicted NBD/HSP70 family sugar kinase